MRTDAARRRALFAAVFLLGLAFFLPALLSRDNWIPLETRYATVAREMVETGDYLVPKLNGEPYEDKPPLFFWMAAALRHLGCGALGVRIASALLGAGALVATAALAGLWFSRRAALLAAAILATTPEFGWLSRFGELDVALTFFTTLATYGWFAGGRAVALFYLGIGLAVMVKGPPGALVPVLAVIAGRLAHVGPTSRRMRRHLAWGPLLALAPPVLWLGPALLVAGPSYARELIGHHVLGRVVDSWQHPQPFYFYVTEASANFLPWLALAIPAGVRAWRRRRTEPASALLLYWLALGLACFSAVSGKRIAYILPLAPAFAVLVARGLEALLLEADPPERRTVIVLRVLHYVFAGMGIALLAFGLGGGALLLRRLRFDDYVVEALLPIAALPGGTTVALGGILLLGGAVFGLRAARRERRLASSWALVWAMVAGFLLADAAFVPRVDSYKSPRPVSARMDVLVPPGEGEVGIYPDAHSGGYNLYSARVYLTPLGTAATAKEFLEQAGRRLVVTNEKGFARRPDPAGKILAEDLPGGVRILDAGRVGRDRILFLVNFDPAE